MDLAADPEGPHYAVGSTAAVRTLTSGWTGEVGRLLERLLAGTARGVPTRGRYRRHGGHRRGREPGTGPAADPTGAPSRAWAVVVGMPDGRALRRLCREHGPWRTVPLSFTDGPQVAQAFDADAVALVVDGGRREGPPADAGRRHGVAGARAARGRAAALFIEGTMLTEHVSTLQPAPRGGDEGGSA